MNPFHSKLARVVSLVCLAVMLFAPALAGGQRRGKVATEAPPASPIFYPVGRLTTARANHAALLLPSGMVLVVGGDDGASALATAELYNPETGGWSSAGFMHDGRRNPSVVLLEDGRVLVSGGLGPTSPALSSAEIYDPEMNTWTLTGRMNKAAGNQTATLLPNGKVLVTGGDDVGATFTRSELYDPDTELWTNVANLETGRYGHRANLLPNGKVLVTGGHNGFDRIGTAEIYDPAANRWEAAGNMTTATPWHTATSLSDGKVLIVGGIGSISVAVSRVEVFVPNGVSWLSAPSLSERRAYHATALLPDGRVLVVGGNNLTGNIGTSEIYDPTLGTWTPGPVMTTARAGATATTLLNGDVLVAGGNHNGSLATSEIYGIADCGITCNGDVSVVTGSATATGANVTFANPSSTGTCGPVVCNPPSGSFFVVGTSTVTCSAGFGAECSFLVTVINNPPPTVTAVEYVKPQSGRKPRVIVRGTGFASGVRLRIDGIDFVNPPTLDGSSTLTQEGKLTDGRNVKKALPKRTPVNLTIVNTDGGSVSLSYTRP